MLLAGDIGGTKIHLAIYAPEGDARTPLAAKVFAAGNYWSLENVIEEFLQDARIPVRRACFAVAGPVLPGKVKITNLPWEIDGEYLGRSFHLDRVDIINDMSALAYSLSLLADNDLKTIKEGKSLPGGNRAVIAPGTGLGEGFLVWDGLRYLPFASEGGHCDFAPCTPIQVELLLYLQKKMTSVSFESVCSGRGLPRIYEFFREVKGLREPPGLAGLLKDALAATPVIVAAAKEKSRPCEICRKTLETFAAILAAEAGNLGLKVISTGGLYIGGGMAPRVLEFLQESPFLEAFHRKEAMAGLLEQMPLYAITNPAAALIGAAGYGLAGYHQANSCHSPGTIT